MKNDKTISKVSFANLILFIVHLRNIIWKILIILPLILPIFKNINPVALGQGNANYDVVNLYIDDNNWKISLSNYYPMMGIPTINL